MPVAFADDFGHDYREFSTTIRRAQESCRLGATCTLSAQSGLHAQLLFAANGSVAQRIDNDTVMRLRAIAFEQAAIWADTILEGDYISDGATRLEAIQGIYRGEELLGYRIIYSELAWYTGECRFDSSDVSTLAGCQVGRIIEASFVSHRFTSWMRDETAFAKFVDWR
jgi:hypothetical protein